MADQLLDRVVAAVGDRYEIEGELGRGGMAVVYRARDVRLRRPLALKVLPPDLAYRGGVRERFLREAQTAAQLNHPNIVPIYAADDVGGVAYLAMALVDGETLAQRLARDPRPPVAFAQRVLAEVADALAYAHARGVVHRDVKPDNILLDRHSGRAVVTDFGIARAAEADLRITVTGVAVGTPAYMSPEQALGEHEVDGRSDIYSLGIVAYQMLAGATPFQTTSAAAMLMKHVGERPRPLGELRPDVPPAIAAAVDRALAKKPADRWADAAAFRDALLADGPVPDAPPPRAAGRPVASSPEPPRGGAVGIAGVGIGWGRTTADAAAALRDKGIIPGPPPAAPPPVPVPPPVSRDWREEQRMWREQLQAQRREWRARERAQRETWRDQWPAPGGGLAPAPAGAHAAGAYAAGMPPMPPGAIPGGVHEGLLDEQVARFRRRTIGSAVLLAFLGVLNIATMAASGFPFPWVFFPAWGIVAGLRRRWRLLARHGLDFWDVMLGRDRPEERAAKAAAKAAERARRGPPPQTLVRRLHRSLYWLVGFSFATAMILAIAGGVDEDFVAMLLFALPGLLIAGISSIRRARAVRRAGMRVRDALSSQWQRAVVLADKRPREAILAEEAARLAAPEVVAGPHGPALRQALDDRLTVRDTLAKLSPEDRALIPDVLPTVDALVDRVAGLVGSLHRIDGDVPADLLAQIERRLAAARAEPAGSPDRERKLQLLERQRASLADLAERRTTLAAQLESAQLVLQNIKLDLLKLRSAGVGAAIADVSTATQEARALSRDIQYALDAAAEVRGA